MPKQLGVSTAVLHKFHESAASSSRMAVELRSREVLVGWAAYCAMHAACRRRHPDLQSFGVALDWRALRLLVLSDRSAVDAALGVAAYLQQHSREGRAVFSLQGGGAATFQLAEQFARGADGSWLRQIWLQEVAAAEARKQAHWGEVQSKQRLAAQLRAQLDEDHAALAAAEAAYNQAREEHRTTRNFVLLQSCISEMSRAQRACHVT